MRIRYLFLVIGWMVVLSVKAVSYTVEMPHADGLYAVGDEVTLKVTAVGVGGEKLTTGSVSFEVDNYGSRKIASGVVELAEQNPFSVVVRSDRSGFVRLTLRQEGTEDFVWSVGFGVESIRPGSLRPDDFDAFWTEAKAKYDREIPVDVKLEPLSAFSDERRRTYRLSLTTPHGRTLDGVLTEPVDLTKGPYPVRLSIPGAGPSNGCPMDGGAEKITLRMNVHHYPLVAGQHEHSATNATLMKLDTREAEECERKYGCRRYWLGGLAASREECHYYDCILAISRAFDWLWARPEVKQDDFRYSGTSQGGGLGLILTGFNEHITRAAVYVPALTDMLGSLDGGRQSGWPRPIETCPLSQKAAIMKNAPYFDAAHFATHISVPIRIAVGLSDSACAPGAVFAGYNMIQSVDKDILSVPGMTHAVKREVYSALDAWLDGEPSRRSSVDYIDSLIGTEGEGTQYGGMMPYVGVPFGSFHLVPMTRLNGVGRLSFNQADDQLIGFILTRQPAIWMGDWGAVRISLTPRKIESLASTPYLGKVRVAGKDYEYTATAHAAWIRGDLSGVWLPNGYDANRDDAGLGYPLPNFKGWRYVVHDPAGRELKVGVSLISLEQAKANLERELGGRTFEEVVGDTRRQWEEYFSRIEIDASEDVKRIFYTAVFHTLLYPRQIGEYGRYYSAFDDKIHVGDMYTCFSLWDTYRAEHPWLTLIAPERVDGMMQSLLEMYREGGWLPKWPNPSYTGIMIGAPAEIVLAEAWVKGFRGFDLELAYEAVRKNAMQPQENDASFVWEDRGQFGRTPETRGGLGSYMRRGYVACDETAESVSRTQDFCFDDRAAAVLAEATGRVEDAEMFRRRSFSYTNLCHAATGRFLPRRADGTFASADVEIKGSHGWGHAAYCEQTEKTAVWGVPFDTDGKMKMLGGKAEAVRRLDEFFDGDFWKAERGNRSVHGNEPSHHCAYLYNRFGAPEMTQLRVRQILTRAYSTDRKGFDGNEDCGQMSAWYILSALGFYPLDPTTGEYELGSPIVKSATLRFGAPYPASTLKITVRNYAPDRWCVRRVTLNGQALSNWRVRHADLVKGGELAFEMID